MSTRRHSKLHRLRKRVSRLEYALEQLGAEILHDSALRVKHRTMFLEFINQQMRRDLAEAQARIKELEKR